MQAGTQLMAVVPLAGAYIVANYKETQLTDVHPGQTVEIDVDMFPGVESSSGHVDSIAPASGQEFALLPPDNATGNFTKVVQRIPVKIVLDPGRPARRRAAAGHVGLPDHRHQARRAPRSRHDAPAEPAAWRHCREAEPCPAQQQRWHHAGRRRLRRRRQRTKPASPTWIAVLAGMIGAFMAILNIQITNASLLDIEGGIGTGVDNGAWISTSYLIGEIVVIPLTSYLSRVFSFRSYMIGSTFALRRLLDGVRLRA